MDKFVIIDGNSLINRAFYALPMLANFDGVVSNGVFGFTNILVKIINEIKPKYICVALDYGKKTFRNEIYKDYKGTRKPTPKELVPQFKILRDMLNIMNIKFIEKQGIEADDIIGSLTKKFDVENIVVTGDRDSFQLINKNTCVYFTKKGISETINLTVDNLKDEYGVNPEQVVDLKSLMGDSSDNIPGVAGVGEKTALTLINTYGSLDEVYNNIDNISGKLKEKLLLNKDNAYLSKQLATIKCDVELDDNLKSYEYEFPFNNDVLNFFKQYQFNSLIKRSELFSSENNEIIDKVEVEDIKCETIKASELESFCALLTNLKEVSISFDEELKIYVPDENCEYSIDFNEENKTEVLNKLKSFFENEKVKKIVFDLKNLKHILQKYNISFNGASFDVLIARYLINSLVKSDVSLKTVIDENLLSDKFLAYSLFLLKEKYLQKLKELGLENLFYNIEMPLCELLFKMEENGFKIDVSELNKLDNQYSKQLDDLTNLIYEMAGETFNINSPKQLANILFDKLKLQSYNNKKQSTSVDYLLEMANQHPIINLILNYRTISKLYTTYIKAFESLIDKNTNKIHTVFNQTLTATGRLSSSEPNLQNIPVRKEEGKVLRKIFIPSFNHGYIVSADYSQIELRLLAAFSGDEKLIEAFLQNKDIHATTASEIFNVNLNDVTSAMRRDAKAINFGIIYGISDYGLSQNIGSTRKMAAEYIKTYFNKYPKVKSYMDENVKFCKENGFIKTYFGRIRNIPEINATNFMQRTFGERAAMNMPLQGSASDIIKLAMIKVDEELTKNKLQSKLILQIHDELLIDTKKDELEKVKAILKDCMENVVKLSVPLTVEVSYGENWFEAK